jgi:hypothetical protein
LVAFINFREAYFYAKRSESRGLYAFLGGDVDFKAGQR